MNRSTRNVPIVGGGNTAKPHGAGVKAEKPFRLTDRQVGLFANDMREFGYDVTDEEIRKIADAVCSGVTSNTDVVALLLKKQLEEAGILLPKKERIGRTENG